MRTADERCVFAAANLARDESNSASDGAYSYQATDKRIADTVSVFGDDGIGCQQIGMFAEMLGQRVQSLTCSRTMRQ